jgi:hypothetical protein
MVKNGLIQPPASSIKSPEVCGFSRRISQSGKSPYYLFLSFSEWLRYK